MTASDDGPATAIALAVPRGLAALSSALPALFVSHSSPRTTKPYDRRASEVSLDEYERVGI